MHVEEENKTNSTVLVTSRQVVNYRCITASDASAWSTRSSSDSSQGSKKRNSMSTCPPFPIQAQINSTVEKTLLMHWRDIDFWALYIHDEKGHHLVVLD